MQVLSVSFTVGLYVHVFLLKRRFIFLSSCDYCKPDVPVLSEIFNKRLIKRSYDNHNSGHLLSFMVFYSYSMYMYFHGRLSHQWHVDVFLIQQ